VYERWEHTLHLELCSYLYITPCTHEVLTHAAHAWLKGWPS
jgi:hypothetical protein